MDQKQQPSKVLHIILWIAQILLAAMFGMAGFTKLMQPLDVLTAMMPWTADVPLTMVRFIGASELLAAIGLIAPAGLRIRPVLTPIAAAGLVIVMVLASGFHLSRGEAPAVGVNAVFALIAVFVAWGRFKKAPIAAKL